MILKQIDDKSKQIETLRELLAKSKSEAQKKLIDADLKRVESGYKAEQDNAYYLDFVFEKSKNVLLLHDIRLEHNGRVAQFDHLLISRLGIELLETKSAKGTMTINSDGSLTLKNNNYTNTYPNPLEQSKRHALVLREFIDSHELLSKRVDILGGIEISSKVLIHPSTNITNKKLPVGFERGDSFVSNRNKELDNASFFKAIILLSKVYNIGKAKEIAELLINAHTPVDFDYAKKFKLKKEDENIREDIADIKVQNVPQKCPRCNEGVLVLREAKSKQAKEKYEKNSFWGCSRYPACRYTQ
ncbi:MAG: NERD domain-containing protein [Sulfurimonas sp.]|uniref:NERD domain-containing protein n=1 Tax=Sulfurimonas sp. TaxID=2022749 RepID=UPI0028CBCBB2|nr:NERD domain-containing protein [Sulfurimonas sp.]MDT8337779.1 NERD domain-containing protein [Sulfurimonas sp.]